MLRRAFLKALGAGAGLTVTPFARAACDRPYPYVVIHRHGHRPCGGIAFRLTHRPQPGDLLLSKDAAYPDGRPMTPNGPLMCHGCNRPLDQASMAEVEFIG